MASILVPESMIRNAVDKVSKYYGIEVIGIYGSCARRFCKLEPGRLDINVLVDIGYIGDVAKWYSKEYGMTVILGIGHSINPWMAYPTTQIPLQTVTTVLAHHAECMTSVCYDIVSELLSKVSNSDREMMAKSLIYVGYLSARKPTRLKSIQRALLDFIAYGVLWLEDPSYIPSLMGNDEIAIIRKYMGDQFAELAMNVISAKLGYTVLDYVKAGNIIASWVESNYDLEELRRARDYVSSRYIDTSYALLGEWNSAWQIVYTTMRDIGFDVVLSVDPHDEDVVIFDLSPSERAYVEQLRLYNNYRVDRIHATIDFDKYYKVDVPKPAFQPLSFVLATHSIPVTLRGVEAKRRARAMVEKEEIAAAYIYLSRCFLEGLDDCPPDVRRKSFRVRLEQGAPPNKLVIPLYRVLLDLLPRAYILLQGRWPEGEDILDVVDRDMVELLLKQYREPDINDIIKIYNYVYNLLYAGLPVSLSEYYEKGRDILREAGIV